MIIKLCGPIPRPTTGCGPAFNAQRDPADLLYLLMRCVKVRGAL